MALKTLSPPVLGLSVKETMAVAVLGTIGGLLASLLGSGMNGTKLSAF